MLKYVAIEGCIGSGKTTLAKMLAEELNGRLLLERFEENPFLENFYENPTQYAFSTEMSFLADRYKQLNEKVISDLFQPLLISDYAPFKSLLFAKQNLNEVEFNLYEKFYALSLGKLTQPALVLHLSRPLTELQSNIQRRNRSFEQEISNNYLESISNRYTQFYSRYESSVIWDLNLKGVDFVKDKAFFAEIAKELVEKLGGGRASS